jgi:hypothetical protein
MFCGGRVRQAVELAGREAHVIYKNRRADVAPLSALSLRAQPSSKHASPFAKRSNFAEEEEVKM